MYWPDFSELMLKIQKVAACIGIYRKHSSYTRSSHHVYSVTSKLRSKIDLTDWRLVGHAANRSIHQTVPVLRWQM